ncbi:unnamed protein product [Hydatigera taeniaeformis]|uniref:Ion_trans_2 domain-containing protein n=1 Tax=Hydatigena taeniaeformis TaxID=6205 RepID=A0A0R3WIP9_HYDTA|nr:unnamed protein product [Hydatigera taeniaeformis]
MGIMATIRNSTMWRGARSSDIGRTGKFESKSQGNVESSTVYFVLSPEWKAAVTEKEKVYLIVCALFYFVSLLVFSYCLVLDKTMVHSLCLKVFLNTQSRVPILQKVNLGAKITFTTGIWYRSAETLVEPQRSPDTYVGAYPIIHERLNEAYSLYYSCLDAHFRTSPVLTASSLFLVVGSVTYAFAGPLVILSRSAFYHCIMIGSLLLASFVLLNLAACNFLYDCLRRSQSTQINDSGTYVESMYGTTLFDIMPHMEDATTAKVATYLTVLGFLPMAIMGGMAGKVLGRPV